MTIVLASVRRRRTAFVATFLSVFLGSSIVMAFAAMLDTSFGDGVPKADRTTLSIVATVVGGWGAIIVASAVATTVAVAARQRATELALLRSAGATPRQVVRLIVGETAVVAAAGAVLAVPVGYVLGRGLLAMLSASDQVSSGVDYRFGGAALGVGVGVGFVVALLATRIAARRAARRTIREAMFEADAGGRRIGRVRFWAGLVCLGIAAQNVVLSLTMVDGKKVYDVQMIASEACIFAGIGFALLSPIILDRAVRLLGGVVGRVGGTAGELAVAGIRQRVQQAATPLMPIIVVTSIAMGTLYMQAVTNALHAKSNDKVTETLNYVVVGMIVVFAAVMLVNLVVTVMNDRRGEFAQQRLVGATQKQLLTMVGAESAVLLAVGLLFGTIGGLLTVVPFTLKTTHSVVPDASIGIYVGIVLTVAALTVGAMLVAGRRAAGADAVSVLREAANA